MPAKFERFTDRRGKHRWRLKSPNGQIISDSAQGYTEKRHRDKSIDRMKELVPSAAVVDV